MISVESPAGIPQGWENCVELPVFCLTFLVHATQATKSKFTECLFWFDRWVLWHLTDLLTCSLHLIWVHILPAEYCLLYMDTSNGDGNQCCGCGLGWNLSSVEWCLKWQRTAMGGCRNEIRWDGWLLVSFLSFLVSSCFHWSVFSPVSFTNYTAISDVLSESWGEP